MVLLEQATIMALLILLGFLCFKIKIIDDNSKKCLSAIALKVATPALIVMSFQKDFDPEKFHGLIYSLLLALITYVVAFVISYGFMRGKQKDKTLIERFSLIYTNCAFMGIPLVQGLYGDDGVFYLTGYLVCFYLLVWTHGVIMMNNTESIGKSALKALKSPALISIVVGVVFYLLQIKLPDMLSIACDYVGSLTTPLGMFVAGATIAQTNLKKTVLKPKLYIVSAVRLFLVPLAVILVFKLLPYNELIMGVNLIAVSSPCAAIATMFAVTYNKDSCYAAELFAITTLLSIATMPFMIWLFEII